MKRPHVSPAENQVPLQVPFAAGGQILREGRPAVQRQLREHLAGAGDRIAAEARVPVVFDRDARRLAAAGENYAPGRLDPQR